MDKDCVLVQAGCSAILDGLAWCLGEEGDSCIVPAPVYPAFTNDFWARSRVHLHMAQTTGVCVCVCVCVCVLVCVHASLRVCESSDRWSVSLKFLK